MKIGRWLGTDDWYHKCSECGELTHFWYRDNLKICPKCKARMKPLWSDKVLIRY